MPAVTGMTPSAPGALPTTASSNFSPKSACIGAGHTDLSPSFPAGVGVGTGVGVGVGVGVGTGVGVGVGVGFGFGAGVTGVGFTAAGGGSCFAVSSFFLSPCETR